jgi:hypothetical protein
MWAQIRPNEDATVIPQPRSGSVRQRSRRSPVIELNRFFFRFSGITHRHVGIVRVHPPVESGDPLLR